MNVVIYTTPTCSFCHQAKEYLSNKGMEFIEHNVSVDKTAADDMMRKSGQMGVRGIIFDEQVIIGFDRTKLGI